MVENIGSSVAFIDSTVVNVALPEEALERIDQAIGDVVVWP
jgi:hypothetical protein